jgi:hypothetical protein
MPAAHLTTSDREIRTALHAKLLKSHHTAPDTLVVDELGLSHAKVRIDIAVINGCVHGYEIKSSLDTLDRLPSQLAFYRRCLGRLTLVCASTHSKRALTLLPDWCGLVEVEKGPRGAIHLTTTRRSRANPELDAVQLAHLLWRGEAADLLARHGASPRELRSPRKKLYAMLADFMSPKELTAAIREFMQQRQAWRDRPTHA